MIRPVALAVATLVLSLTAVGVACQTYDFEPVTPLTLAQTTQSTPVSAHNLKPNVMLLVDKSGSMSGPIMAGDPQCTPGCGPGGPACPAGCKTRISELRSAMNTFLTSSGTVARMGLAFFPADSSCGSTAAISADFPPENAAADDNGTDAALIAKAMDINQKITAIAPNGGTPTADSLAFVGTKIDLTSPRLKFVLLMTDGLPNCNANNQNATCTCNPNICGSCAASNAICPAQAMACSCTTSSCAAGTALCAKGCLDGDGSTATIADLNSKGIKTIVVGFGADTAGGTAATVLNSMAVAGGFARKCKMNSDCDPMNTGADSCDVAAGLCKNKFYQATNGADLATALADISKSLVGNMPCTFNLDSQPSDPRLLSVLFNGVDVPTGPDTWSYSGGAVVFAQNGTYCQQILASTTQKPVQVEIRIVQQL
jgi:hypothetical protein